LEDRKGAGDLRSFRFDRTGPFGVLTFDVPGSRVNLLGQAALNELEWVGEWLPQSGLQGLVVRSAKATGFCAGADLTEIQGLAPRMGVFASKEALRLHFAPFTRAFRKLETGGVPVASVIDGAAMGGGLELALATHARFVTDSTNTRLSLPEFSVGLFPAGGGSQRLPRLIGIEAALPVLTAERMLTAQEAADVGLASLCASAQEAFDAALAWLSTRPGARQPWDRQETDPVGGVQREIGVTGPAADALTRCLADGLGVGMDAGNRIELDALVTLLSRGEPWAIMRLRFRGQRAWQAACRQGATSGIEAVRDAVADLGAGPWSHERLHAAADVAERAAVGLSADERAAADVLVVDDLAVPETIGGLLARGEGLWPSTLVGSPKKV
jgi:3-hydroxyacyl-CoA dehydrogenase/enoyl-CoA hydratase/3-hydroxybutyryl-CoA epimerase